MTGQSCTAVVNRAWVEVDLGALVRNGAALARRAGVPLLPMVKGDAYGLGAVPVALALEALDPWGYGVATVAEGEELRAAGIERSIVVFTPILPQEWPAARAARLTPSIHRAAEVEGWVAAGGGAWQLAVDTGMNRAGVAWDGLGPLVDVLRRHPPAGVFTHFHSAGRADGTQALQEARFRSALQLLPTLPALIHAENSAAVEHGGGSSYTVARPGVFLYGVDSGGEIPVEPVVAMRARVVDLRDVRAGETVSYEASWAAPVASRIATLSVGYADGYRRSLSNRGRVLLHGVSAPVVGKVAMDMTMVDVTDAPCELGDVSTLIGGEGDARLPVREVADMAGLSPYEILTGLRGRLPRTYLHEKGVAG